jgi:hypothetical protein
VYRSVLQAGRTPEKRCLRCADTYSVGGDGVHHRQFNTGLNVFAVTDGDLYGARTCFIIRGFNSWPGLFGVSCSSPASCLFCCCKIAPFAGKRRYGFKYLSRREEVVTVFIKTWYGRPQLAKERKVPSLIPDSGFFYY